MVSRARLTPRAQVRSLLGSGGRRGAAPLFVPLMHVLAAKVEALDIGECLTNPTKLAKGLQALYQALGTDAITCACDGAIEIEALGACTDWSVYPPRVVAPPALEGLDPDVIAKRVAKAPRIAAAGEAIRRLAVTCPGEPVLVAALTGPAALAVQIAAAAGQAATVSAALEAYLETAGRTVLESARQFLLAGANIIMVIEHALPEHQTSSFDGWKSVMTPIANLTRFHRALPMVLATWTSEDLGALPAAIVPCLPLQGSIVEAGRRFGVALPTDNLDWRLPSSPCSVLTTDGEVPFETDIPALRAACEGVRMQIDALSGHGG
jgi:Uroporphyrinogen decarboxylase (URO-D)